MPHTNYSSAGESHCKGVSCIIDGCPPNIQLTESDIQTQLTRRRPGQSALTTPRDEKDRVEIWSGTELGKTLGTPIMLLVRNEDQRPKDYGGSTMDLYPRPSHADYTYQMKYGVRASSGGGRSSARETIGRVAAGAVAEKFLKLAFGVEIVSFVSSVGGEGLHQTDPGFNDLINTITREQVDQFLPTRCPNQKAADRITEIVTQHRDQQDSVGGIVTCVIRGVPAGLGEPCFDKLEAMLGHAMMSIPATKGFELGSGFESAKMKGSAHNDIFIIAPGSSRSPTEPPILTTKTNHSGGIQGGISNGAPIYFNIAFKPPATIGIGQMTATYQDGAEGLLEAKGRHDPCVVPRAVPIVEAMAAMVIADAVLAQAARPKMTGEPSVPVNGKPNGVHSLG